MSLEKSSRNPAMSVWVLMSDDGLIRVGLKKLELERDNRLAARLETEQGEQFKDVSNAETDIVALKTYMDAPHFGEIVIHYYFILIIILGYYVIPPPCRT